MDDCPAGDSAMRGVSQREVQPWHRLGGVEHICELRKCSQVLYSIFATIVRVIYADRSSRSFGCPDVVWSPDPQKTELWIDTELRWEDARPDFTPAIFVSLGDIKYDVAPTLDRQGMTAYMADGEQHYERTASGGAMITHVCDRAGAACSLADNTEMYLSSMQDQIRMEYCFDRFMVSGRSPRNRKETPQMSGKGRYSSTVAVQFEFTDSWMVKHETPILRSVSMIDRPVGGVDVCGTVVKVSDGSAEIEFGDASSDRDTPFEA